jgi:transcriptional regulator of arginine metabolism
MTFYSHGDATRRREEILRIVRDTTVHSQDELLAALLERGVKVTQPTLSRDMRELGLAKTPAGYIVPGDVMAKPVPFIARELRENRLEQLLHESIIYAEVAGNLAVLKTPAASAQPVASAIDSADIEDAVGTIGGDDTIFIAFSSTASAAAFIRRVQKIAGLEPRRRTRA